MIKSVEESQPEDELAEGSQAPYPVNPERQAKIDKFIAIKNMLRSLNARGIFLGKPKTQEVVEPKVDLRPELYAKLDAKKRGGSGGSSSDSGSSSST